jgi:hypothetical protein
MIYQSFDIATSILVGTLIAFITGYAFANITACLSKPHKTMEQVVTEHVVSVLHRQGALATISSGLQMMEHPDTDLFANIISVVYVNNADIIVNEWIIRSVLILSADINNRINGITLSKNIDISSYINDNYENISDSESDDNDQEDVDDEGTTEDEPSDSPLNASQSDESAEEGGDESDAEEEQTSGSSSPVRVKRALTHYSDASAATTSSSENTGIPVTPPSSESDEPAEATTSGESLPSESINSTSESSTPSVEENGNSGITSENS